jgi:type IV secretory pathway TraG/TraD family ATPase VirD4
MSKSAILGWAGLDPSSREPLIYSGDGSLITVARPGSGKSRSVILPNLIHLEGSAIIFDPKGELTRASALWRQQMLGHKVIVFDPFRIIEDKYMPKEAGK